jgi:hypothetical protein
MVMAQSDASNAPSYRGLLALVIFFGRADRLGGGALIVTAVLRAGNRPQPVAVTTPETVLTTLAAPGKSIQSTQLEGNRILVRLAGTNGEDWSCSMPIPDARSCALRIDPRP